MNAHRSKTVVRLVLLIAASALGVFTSTSPSAAQTFDSGSTGADGLFAPTCAPTPCTVAVPLPSSGVFNVTTVSIVSGVTVKLTRNVTNTPVTILATGDVLIAGTIDVGGSRGSDGLSGTSVIPNAGVGGPGGFDGGNGSNGIDAVIGVIGGAGLGPGGAGGLCGGSFGGPGDACGNVIYGTPNLVPLIGGSGGGGTNAGFGMTAPGGGGGGGAILVASSGTITFTGALLARGGDGGNAVRGTSGGGGGSGGAVKLVATTITGNFGRIDVRGGGGGAAGGEGTGAGRTGGVGRVRVEAFANLSAINFVGLGFGGALPSFAAPSSSTTVPMIAITSVAGVPLSVQPTAAYAAPDIVLPGTTSTSVIVTLAGSNIPPGTAVTVSVIGRNGGSSAATATFAGTLASSTASTSVTIRTVEPSVIMATTSFTITAGSGGGPLSADGEAIDRAKVTARLGAPSQVVYITKSGRATVRTEAR